jgi:DNA anti-recombination protein RmuC
MTELLAIDAKFPLEAWTAFRDALRQRRGAFRDARI